VQNHLSDLTHPDIAKPHQQSNVECLRMTLLPSETLLVVAAANRKRFSMGLIGLTTRRFIYVQTRIVRRPIVWSIPVEDIQGVNIELATVYGRIVLELSERERLRFDLVRPKERIYPFLWRIQELIARRGSGEEPLAID
jgi:hypothetical protein